MKSSIKLGLALCISSSLLVSCESAEEELNNNEISLSHPGGDYNYKPWVVLTKSDSGMGSGVLQIKGPSDESFRDADSCSNNPLNESDMTTYCMNVTESGEWSYRLYNSAATSDEFKVNYNIELEERNISIDNTDSLSLKEVETYCLYTSDQEIRLVVENTSESIENKSIYFIAEFPNNEDEILVDETNKTKEYGFDIRSTSDDKPFITESLNYSTNPDYDFDETQGSADCKIEVVENEPGKNVSGTIECTDLAKPTFSSDDSLPLGEKLSISTEWKCDSFGTPFGF